MITLSSSGKMYVTGRGNIYLIDLHLNGLSNFRKDFMKELPMGAEVSIDGITGVIKGIEAFATGENYVHNRIGVLLKEN